jgi:hypothetical protein
MNPKRFFFSLSWLLVIAVLASLSGSPAARAQVGTQGAVNIDQITGATIDDTGATSSYFPNRNPVVDLRAADDFSWQATGNFNYIQLTNITFVGYNSVGTPTIDRMHIRVYANSASNLPGALRGQQSVSVSSNMSGTVPLSINMFLPVTNTVSTRYWVSVQANVTSVSLATWSWKSSSLGGATLESTWIDVLGTQEELGTNCYQQWNRRRTLCSVGTQDNMAFSLTGQEWYLPYFVYLPIVSR